MTSPPQSSPLQTRLALTVLGGAAALALWGLTEKLDDAVLPPMLWLVALAGLLAGAATTMSLAGPVSIGRALAGGLAMGAAAAGLLGLTGLRFAPASDALRHPEIAAVWAAMLFLAIPFVVVRLQDPARWRDHAVLFQTAWMLAVRVLLALIFVGVFWLVVVLSAALLDLVEVDLLSRLLQTAWLTFLLSGAVLGLAMAVIHEMRDRISPDLALRLLRLLLPVLLVVVSVFLMVLPLRGLTQLFGNLSSAAALMATAAVGITLIAAVLDRDEAHAAPSRALQLAARALTFLLPALVALALWALVLRVRDYGWTPDRLLASMIAGSLLAYALVYAVAALRPGWRARIRQSNVILALGVVLASALWLTPVLDAHRISVSSQLTRFESGRTKPDALPLWQLAHDWGRTGPAGLDRLAEGADTDLKARIAEARQLSQRSAFNVAQEEKVSRDLVRDLIGRMAVRPHGVTLTEAEFEGIPRFHIRRWHEGCNRQLPDGRPGCALVRAEFRKGIPAEAQGIVLFLDDGEELRATYLHHIPGQRTVVRPVFDPATGKVPDLPVTALQDLLQDRFRIGPSGMQALVLGESLIVPGF